MSPLDKWRMWLGLFLVLGLIIMAVMFGLGKVEEQTSFGLTQILTIISTIALGWAQWAFPHTLRDFLHTKQGDSSQEQPPPTNSEANPPKSSD